MNEHNQNKEGIYFIQTKDGSVICIPFDRIVKTEYGVKWMKHRHTFGNSKNDIVVDFSMSSVLYHFFDVAPAQPLNLTSLIDFVRCCLFFQPTSSTETLQIEIDNVLVYTFSPGFRWYDIESGQTFQFSDQFSVVFSICGVSLNVALSFQELVELFINFVSQEMVDTLLFILSIEFKKLMTVPSIDFATWTHRLKNTLQHINKRYNCPLLNILQLKWPLDREFDTIDEFTYHLMKSQSIADVIDLQMDFAPIKLGFSLLFSSLIKLNDECIQLSRNFKFTDLTMSSLKPHLYQILTTLPLTQNSHKLFQASLQHRYCAELNQDQKMQISRHLLQYVETFKMPYPSLMKDCEPLIRDTIVSSIALKIVDNTSLVFSENTMSWIVF